VNQLLGHIVWGFLLFFLSVANGQDSLFLDSTKLLKPYKKVELGGSAKLNYFQGDVAHSAVPTGDFVNNLGYSVFFRKPVSKCIGIDYQFSLGKMTVADGPEAFPNLNFQTNLLAHQVGLSISLRQLIYKDNYNPLIYPSIHVGAELMTFQSFGDIQDANGNTYHYWDDGTIKDIAQGSANADAATLLTRDYTYETDLRLMDNDQRGKYSQITYGFPLTFALKARLYKQLHLTAFGTYHLIQSDLIDDVSSFGQNAREGDALMDDYISFGARLSYDFGATSVKDNEIKLKKKLAKKRRKAAKKALKDSKKEKEEKAKDKVEEKPDLTTVEEPDPVVEEEVETEEEVAVVNDRSESESNTDTNSTNSNNTSSSKAINTESGDYMVLIESYKGGVPVDEMNKLLQVKGVKTKKDAKGVLNFEAGGFSKSSAEAILGQVKGNGFTIAYIYTGAPKESKGKEMLGSTFDSNSTTYDKPNDQQVDMNGLVFKVQIAAYKNAVDESRFSSVKTLTKERTNSGVVRYFGGEYKDYKQALNQTSVLDGAGYKGAFVVPYRDGKRISLNDLDLGPSRKLNSSFDTSQKVTEGDLVYRVQLGVFEKEVPFELLSVYLKVKGLDQTVNEKGFTTYFAGSYATYAGAKLAKESVISLGIEGAFLIAQFKGKSISVGEALKLEKN
jgi:hypothetical protein